jgi:hypothetical protein
MSAVTFRIITLNNYKTLKGLLSRKVSISFLLLKPDFTIVLSLSTIQFQNSSLSFNASVTLLISTRLVVIYSIHSFGYEPASFPPYSKRLYAI